LHWLVDSDLFEHFGENCLILLQTVAKWWCIKFCAIFFWTTLCIYTLCTLTNKSHTLQVMVTKVKHCLHKNNSYEQTQTLRTIVKTLWTWVYAFDRFNCFRFWNSRDTVPDMETLSSEYNEDNLQHEINHNTQLTLNTSKMHCTVQIQNEKTRAQWATQQVTLTAIKKLHLCVSVSWPSYQTSEAYCCRLRFTYSR